MEQALIFLEEKKFAELRAYLCDMTPQDIANLFAELSKEDLVVMFRILPKETAAEVFVEMDNDAQVFLTKTFSDKEVKDVLDELFIDDAVDIVEEMPANVVSRILSIADNETRRTINELLKYPDDSVGTIMTVEYIDLKKNMTVAAAFERIRRKGFDSETIYTCYVTDENRKLEGVVTVKTLLLSSQKAIIGDIMETNVIALNTLDDKEVAASQIRKYDFLAMPVTDSENRLVGIVTVDDAIDVLQEENTEDIEKMAAITPTDKPYIKTSVFDTWKNRIPWLLLLMISATFTGKIIQSFEDALATQVALTAFIPMLMDSGGNAGSQSSVTIIRGLSLGEISLKDIFKVWWKEIRVALLCAITLAAANFVKILLIDRVSVEVDLVVCLTLLVVIVVAKLVGCTLPILAKAVKLDPAVMASPFVTTIVDALALTAYFNIATAVLKL